MFWVVLNAVFGLGVVSIAGTEGDIAWEAHIGGFLFGLLCFGFFDTGSKQPVPSSRSLRTFDGLELFEIAPLLHVLPVRDRMSQATGTEVLGLEETSMNVAAILKMKGKGVFTASADTSLLEIAKLLEQHGIGCIVIEGEEGKVVGIVSERDVVRAIGQLRPEGAERAGVEPI